MNKPQNMLKTKVTPYTTYLMLPHIKVTPQNFIPTMIKSL